MPQTPLAQDADTVSPETIAKLGHLLKELNITSAFYVDDYNSEISQQVVTGLLKTSLDNGAQEAIKAQLGDDINIDLPETENILDDFIGKWDLFEPAKQQELYKKVLSLHDSEFNPEEYDRTLRLKLIFPENTITSISPEEWKEKLTELERLPDEEGNILLIFDQDLSQASGEDFRNKRIKGDDLISEVKKSSIWKRSYCALITHIIKTIASEFDDRRVIVQESNGRLNEQDFFALSKIRNEHPELLCDGIKKALLDRYCYKIKQKSISIIQKSIESVIPKINDINTYDFDHTILRSSYEEGVWEAETFFRITRILFDTEIKRNMINEKYAEDVNKDIRKAKSLSDIRFEIHPLSEPYTGKYKLRYLDIYEPDDIINKLHMPLENGDIFEIQDYNNKTHTYILVSQECDLLIRANGERATSNAVLLKISKYSAQKFAGELIDYTKSKLDKAQPAHFFADKFSLSYFINGTDDIGIVKMDSAILVDLDILDLVVFNSNGDAKIDLFEKFDTSILNNSWENRYKYLHQKFSITASYLDDLFIDLSKGKQVEIALTKLLPQISANITLENPYNSGTFSFRIKRTKRFRNAGAKYLLDRYYKHLSRIAEPHDFAG